ncbi:mitochondrial import inner membrane translocase subunit tim54 [Nowakowskiella sp. JEL0078]|nr:mitochondrial import inner membrane translocase subunit tim54 [Nowakowskiella sp. JEL0078]
MSLFPTIPFLKSWKLPSRNWLIFICGVSSISGYTAYDVYQCKQLENDFKFRAKVIANQPLQPSGRVRKVIVFVSPTELARWSFKRHVKPIFDAAALDYDLFDASRPGRIQKAVRERIWDGKDLVKEEHAKALELAEEEAKRRKFWFSLPKQPEEEDLILRANGPKYSDQVGLIAVGRDAWRELLNGINEGCMGQRIPPKIVEKVGVIPVNIGNENDKKCDPLLWVEPLCSESNIPDKSFLFPPIAYIPSKNLEGLKNIPVRLWDWINERKQKKIAGELAMQVVFEETRNINENDLNLGLEFELTSAARSARRLGKDEVPGETIMIHKNILERLRIYL